MKRVMAGLVCLISSISSGSAFNSAIKAGAENITFLQYNQKKDTEEQRRLNVPSLAIVPYDKFKHGKDFIALFRAYFDYKKNKFFYQPDAQEVARVLMLDETLVGLTTYSFKAKGVAHLEYLAVVPHLQKCKLGTALLDYAMADVKGCGIKRITVCPLSKSVKYFEKKGFTACPNDIFILEKQL